METKENKDIRESMEILEYGRVIPTLEIKQELFTQLLESGAIKDWGNDIDTYHLCGAFRIKKV